MTENDAGGTSKGQRAMGERGGQGGPSKEVTFEPRPGGSEGWRLFRKWGKFTDGDDRMCQGPEVGRKVMRFRNRRISVIGHMQRNDSSDEGWQPAVRRQVAVDVISSMA